MGFNILDVVNAATRAEAGENKDYREINLDYRDIIQCVVKPLALAMGI